MTKRANGDGSIYYSNALSTWVAEIMLPDGTKKRKKNKLQRVVRSWLETEREAVRGGTWTGSSNARYADFIDRYMAEVGSHTLRPKTLECYTYTINRHIKPNLGEMKIASIRPDHLSHFYSNLLNSGLSKHTVRYIHAIIRKSLRTARTWGLVGRNVAEDVTPPAPETHEITPLTVDEVKRFLKVLENDRLYAFYVLISTTGIRKGEALGLQKTNLDLKEGVVRIRHSLTQLNGIGLTLGDPKSKSSKRDLALPEFAIKVLKAHLERYPNSSSYVFATGNNTPFSPRNILRHFKGKLIEAGLPITTRLHDFRHSVISWLLASGGISVKDAQGMAGHSQASVTLNVYGHLLPGYNRNAANKVQKLFDESN